jgi:hypothetical protein
MPDNTTNPVDSAKLILELYDLRREDVMRKARAFVVTFDPHTFEEFIAEYFGANSAYLRMVLSYWNMAASFVLNGAIDRKMFEDANGEHILVFAKVEPFLPQFREMMAAPQMLGSLEQLCLSMPDARQRIDGVRERIRGMLASRAAGQQSQG